MMNRGQDPTARLEAAIAAGDVDALGAVLGEAAPPLPMMQAAAALCMRRQRWREAVMVFDRMSGRDTASELQRRVAGNLAAMQACRPAVYAALMKAGGNGKYTIGRTASGMPTVLAQQADGHSVRFAPSENPLEHALAFVRSIQEERKHEAAMAVCGVGDGYVLNALARNSAKLAFGQRPPVFVIEPDAAVLMTCMMIHDLSGPGGPIEQERFIWLVGPGWADDLRRLMRDEPMLAFPVFSVYQGLDQRQTQAALTAVLNEYQAQQEELQRKVDAYYARLSGEELAAVLGGAGPRRPRVMLITTRFSSVLQYSTADAAEALRQIGCEALVLMEPSPVHNITQPAMRRALAEFRPDLVFQIDHLRHEHGRMFPESLPFACWIQDALPNLTSREAGAKVGARDFVLTAQAMYAARYGYPRRQIVPVHRLTRVGELPAAWESDGADLAYVSNASQRPIDAALRIIGETAGMGQVRAVVELACKRMLDLYARDESLPTHRGVSELVGGCEKEMGAIGDATLRRQIVEALFDRLNNLLYRQQAIGWAAGISRELGLTLALYGRGWEGHDEFAGYARGPVEYGQALAELTRRTKINLQVEPYFAISHQRLLDGIAAGGFFLVRHHPSLTILPKLAAFAEANLPGEVETTEEALEAVGDDRRGELQELLDEAQVLGEWADPIEQTRQCQRSSLIVGAAGPLPHLGGIVFGGREEMRRRIEEYVENPERRRAIAMEQRESIGERLSYVAGMRRMLRRIGELVGEKAAAAAA